MSKSVLPVRIYYEDTDFSGLVYHANYLKFIERGRTEALREAGFHHSALLDADDPCVFTVRSVTMDFIKPAFMDDLLEVHTRVQEVRGARIIFLQEIFRGEVKLFSATVEVATITPAGRPRRLPPNIREGFARLGR